MDDIQDVIHKHTLVKLLSEIIEEQK
jgi:hypothetical protein